MIISLIIPLLVLILSLIGVSVVLHEVSKVQENFINALKVNMLEKSIQATFSERINEIPNTFNCSNPNMTEYLKYENKDKVIIIYFCNTSQQLMINSKAL